MVNARLLAIFVTACLLALQAEAETASVAPGQVREAMAKVEILLARQNIDVRGYAGTEPPIVERVAASHEYLQGNDGGYVDGRIYLNGESMSECEPLTLIHELVHDATVKHRLFADVSNSDIRDVLEALADMVTAAAAEEPYLPGCLPNRHILVSAADLASLAQRR
ncbi:MAG: hypothetical protein ABL996_05195 [Micropepsaceae bacterium]